jgi:hypothetical protein
MRDYKNIIKEAELLASSPESVVAYLKERSSQDGDDALEQAVLGLNHPLIDLALAQYGRSIDVLKSLFHRRQLALRVAVLANQCTFNWLSGLITQLFDNDSTQLRAYLTSASGEEIRALFQNPELDYSLLSDFLNVGGFGNWRNVWDALDERKQQIAVIALKGHEKLKPPPPCEIEGGSFYEAAWKLAEKVPVTVEWAAALTVLHESLPPPHRNSFVYIDNPLDIASRWHPTGHEELEKEKKNALSIFDFSWFQKVRYNLAKFGLIYQEHTVNAATLFESEDVAFRVAAYFCGDLTLEQITQAHKKDGELAFNSLVENKYLWKHDEKREALNNICSLVGRKGYGSPFPRRKFNAFWETFEKEHPDWFQTEEDKLKDPVTKGDLEKLTDHTILPNFQYLSSKINILENNLKYIFWFSFAVLLIAIDQYF